ncbi:cleavage and polyadenylation specificity factor subunit 4-like [Corticium candelabrum]|uniref:cleavage and polyadenylation specificity factor subunit 4-like n=1 Tax=Corticium candelabrum TaxID=121492 RepID=UPI002E2EBECD|nr:cleavage and polyadenylation specificity factor subunit 4-like [Corticium candelabrum]
MQEIICNVDDVIFDIEISLELQLGAQPLPFEGMDKSGAAICEFFLRNVCPRGSCCPFRHTTGDKSVVCKHWLRGLCKKGDLCEFLHEYDMTKMPECYFYAKYGVCNNKDCPYQHIDPESKMKDCPWYDRGFCKHGPHCRNRHTRRVLCQNYLCGFCVEGSHCKFVHPRFELPTYLSQGTSNQGTKLELTHFEPQPYVPGVRRPLDQVTCFKCGEKGHYANRCPRGAGAMAVPQMRNAQTSKS